MMGLGLHSDNNLIAAALWGGISPTGISDMDEKEAEGEEVEEESIIESLGYWKQMAV